MEFLDYIINLDRELLYAINGFSCKAADYFMLLVTNKWSGIPIYIFAVFYLIYKNNTKAALFMIGAVILTFALTDRLAVILFKETFERLRPTHDPITSEVINILEGKGGLYGFISNHAANCFGFAYITSKLIRKRWYTIPIFIWATLVGYSRIYVGKHFPADVVCGALFGVLVAFMVYKLYIWLNNKYFPKYK